MSHLWFASCMADRQTCPSSFPVSSEIIGAINIRPLKDFHLHYAMRTYSPSTEWRLSFPEGEVLMTSVLCFRTIRLDNFMNVIIFKLLAPEYLSQERRCDRTDSFDRKKRKFSLHRHWLHVLSDWGLCRLVSFSHVCPPWDQHCLPHHSLSSPPNFRLPTITYHPEST